MTCPAASSTVPVASTAPGRNATNGGMSARIGFSASKALAVANTIVPTRNDASTGMSICSVANRNVVSRPTQETEHEGHEQASPRRLQQQREADAQHSVTEDPDPSTALRAAPRGSRRGGAGPPPQQISLRWSAPASWYSSLTWSIRGTTCPPLHAELHAGARR